MSWADALVITFDERSTTEDGYDYLAFYRDAACTQLLAGTNEKYCGIDGCQARVARSRCD